MAGHRRQWVRKASLRKLRHGSSFASSIQRLQPILNHSLREGESEMTRDNIGGSCALVFIIKSLRNPKLYTLILLSKQSLPGIIALLTRVTLHIASRQQKSIFAHF